VAFVGCGSSCPDCNCWLDIVQADSVSLDQGKGCISHEECNNQNPCLIEYACNDQTWECDRKYFPGCPACELDGCPDDGNPCTVELCDIFYGCYIDEKKMEGSECVMASGENGKCQEEDGGLKCLSE